MTMTHTHGMRVCPKYKIYIIVPIGTYLYGTHLCDCHRCYKMTKLSSRRFRCSSAAKRPRPSAAMWLKLKTRLRYQIVLLPL